MTKQKIHASPLLAIARIIVLCQLTIAPEGCESWSVDYYTYQIGFTFLAEKNYKSYNIDKPQLMAC